MTEPDTIVRWKGTLERDGRLSSSAVSTGFILVNINAGHPLYIDENLRVQRPSLPGSVILPLFSTEEAAITWKREKSTEETHHKTGSKMGWGDTIYISNERTLRHFFPAPIENYLVT